MYISILYTLHFLYYSYITILIVNPPLKIFQIFLRRKIFYRFVFWKEKKKELLRSKFERCWRFHVLTYMSNLPILLYFNISITISQQIGDKIAFIRVYRIASFIEVYVMVFLLLFKGPHVLLCSTKSYIAVKQ